MKKFITILLIFSLIFSSFLFNARKANALVVWDLATELFTGIVSVATVFMKIIEYVNSSDDILAKILKFTTLIALTLLMNQITNDIVNWINSGFDGKPGFIQNPEKLLGDIGNKTAGSVLTTFLGPGICEPFKLNIQIPLSEVKIFEDQIKCTLSDVVGNIDSFYDDFQKGGWLAWIHLTRPQNNAYGAFALGANEMVQAEMKAKKNLSKEIDRNKGFLSLQECKANFDSINVPTGQINGVVTFDAKTQEGIWEQVAKATTDSQGTNVFRIKGEIQCSTKTPSEVISNSINQTINSGNDILQKSIASLTSELGTAGKFIEPFLFTIINALINKGLMEGLAAAQKAFVDEETSPLSVIPDQQTLNDTELVDMVKNDKAAIEDIRISLNPNYKQQLINKQDLLKSTVDSANTIQQKNTDILKTEGKIAAINEALTQGGRIASCLMPGRSDWTITKVIISSNSTIPNATGVDKMARNIQVGITDSEYGKATITPSVTLNILTASVQTGTDLLTNDPIVGAGVNSVNSINPPGYQTNIDQQKTDLTNEKNQTDGALTNIDPALLALETYYDNIVSFIDLGNAALQTNTAISQTDKDSILADKNNALQSLDPIIGEPANDGVSTYDIFETYSTKINVETINSSDRANQLQIVDTDLNTQLTTTSADLTTLETNYLACAAY